MWLSQLLMETQLLIGTVVKLTTSSNKGRNRLQERPDQVGRQRSRPVIRIAAGPDITVDITPVLRSGSPPGGACGTAESASMVRNVFGALTSRQAAIDAWSAPVSRDFLTVAPRSVEQHLKALGLRAGLLDDRLKSGCPWLTWPETQLSCLSNKKRYEPLSTRGPRLVAEINRARYVDLKSLEGGQHLPLIAEVRHIPERGMRGVLICDRPTRVLSSIGSHVRQNMNSHQPCSIQGSYHRATPIANSGTRSAVGQLRPATLSA